MSLTAQSPVAEDIVIPPAANDMAPLYSTPPTFGRRWFSREILQVATVALRLLDIAALVLASYLASALMASAAVAVGGLPARYALIGTLLAPMVLQGCGAYRSRGLMSGRGAALAGIGGCLVLGALVAGIALGTAGLDRTVVAWGAVWLATGAALLVGTRLAVSRAIGTMIRSGRMRDVIAVVGAGPLADRLITHLTTLHNRQPGRCPIEIVGVFDERRERIPAGCRSAAGGLDDLITLGKEGVIDRVVITLPWSAETRLLEIRNKLQALAIEISLCPDGIAFSAPGRQEAEFGDLPLLALAHRPLQRWDAVVKRAEDVALASLALLLFGPMMCFIAIAVKLDSDGPALFRQRRHGFNNREIEVYKFRTMRTDQADASGGVQTSRGDARITRLGGILRKTSLDELPQLLNVLKGDMSMVGPRPHPVGMRTKDKLCHEIVETYATRHRVKPGITGWAQVNGYRGATSEPEHLVGRVEHDLYYIDNWSLLFDLKILMKTVSSVITTDNAF